MNKYIALLDGKQIGKRTSKDRIYTHALVGREIRKAGTTEIKALTWCGSLELAHKQLSSYSRAAHFIDLQIVEATRF